MQKGLKSSLDAEFGPKGANEIWHIDVTKVRLITGEMVHVQIVVDNYSRFVVAWRVNESIGASETVRCLRDAVSRSFTRWKSGERPFVMMDAGTETRNFKVGHFILSQNMKRLVAGVDTTFSNPMVKAVFRSLKTHFIGRRKIESVRHLERLVRHYFKD